MKPFPDRFITPRLIIAPVGGSDSAALYRLLSDAEVLRYTDIRPHLTHAQTIELIEQWTTDKSTKYWSITPSSGGELTGILGLYHIEPYHRFASLQAILSKACWQKGIMSEAIRPVLGYAFQCLELHRVEAQVYAHHTASCNMLSGLGFRCEATLRENFLIEGIFRDSLLFSILSTEFRLEPEKQPCAE